MTKIKIETVIDLLASATESLEVCIDFETQQRNYAIASLLYHVIRCIQEALKNLDKKLYEYRVQISQAREVDKGVG